MQKDEWKLGYCLINCSKCGTYSEGECAGCKSSSDQQWSGDCKFRPCAREKGHEYCHQCDEFPCEHIDAFDNDAYEHHSIAVRNMERAKEIGVDEWLKQQPRVMYCPGWKF